LPRIQRFQKKYKSYSVFFSKANYGIIGFLLILISSVPIFAHLFRYEGVASTVAVAGSFNGWNSVSDLLKETSDGVFELSLELPPGTHQYKFVVDGKWTEDPTNPEKSADGFGGFNSIIRVEGKKVRTPEGKYECVKDGKWYIEFSYFDPSYKGYKIYLYCDGEKWIKDYDGEVVSFTLPLSSGFHTAFLWAQDKDGSFSDTERIPKNFSDEISWPQRVIYSIVTDRFMDGDKSNNKPVEYEGLLPKANYIGGDFSGIEKKIREGYFSMLGVNCLWLSPVVDNVDGAFKDALPPHYYFTGYHGYWPVAKDEVEEHFGTQDELKNLVKSAHSRGIKVMADMVFNHVHEEHPWYKEHPEWFGKLELPNGEKNIRKFDEYPFTTWFDSFLPSFDYSNDEAVRAVVDNAVWWVEEFHFDAFRLDAVKHIPQNFWKVLSSELKNRFGGDFYLVGESIASRKTINDFISPGMLDGQFDFPLYWHIRDTFASGKEGFESLDAELKSSLRVYKNVYYMSPLLGNHDFSRFMAFADEDITDGDEKKIGWERPPRVDNPSSYEKIKNAFTFVLTNPGIPMIYYGDEIGMTGAADPDNRRMMKFDGLDKNEKSVFEHVSKLILFRVKSPAITMGSHTDINVSKDLWIYIKHYFQDSVLVVLNSAAEGRKIKIQIPAFVPAGGCYRSVLTGGKYKIKQGNVVLKIPAAGSDVLHFEK